MPKYAYIYVDLAIPLVSDRGDRLCSPSQKWCPTISDKQEVNQGSQERLGRSLDFLMDVSQSITGQCKDIQIAIPKNLTLKKMKLNLANNFAGISNIRAEQVDIQSVGRFVGIYDSQLQQAQLLNETGSIYVGNSELRDVMIQSYDIGVSHARF